MTATMVIYMSKSADGGNGDDNIDDDNKDGSGDGNVGVVAIMSVDLLLQVTSGDSGGVLT